MVRRSMLREMLSYFWRHESEFSTVQQAAEQAIQYIDPVDYKAELVTLSQIAWEATHGEQKRKIRELEFRIKELEAQVDSGQLVS